MGSLFASLQTIFVKAAVFLFRGALIILKHGVMMAMALGESFYNWAKIKIDKLKKGR